MTESDAIWLAGIFDSRGYVRMRVKPHTNGSQGLQFDCALIVVGEPALLDKIAGLVGAGTIAPRPNDRASQWSLYASAPIRATIAAVTPHLRLPERAQRLAELDRILAMTTEERQVELSRIRSRRLSADPLEVPLPE